MIHAKFVLSAASASDFPNSGLPEIAMVGRSNVGKSSLINALVKQKIARTSAAPGKTRLANYYLIDDAFYIVDLPGYGYARGGRESAETFEILTHQYFDPLTEQGRHLAGVFHLIDARHPELPQDAAAHQWLVCTGLTIVGVATKMDKLTRSEKTRTLKLLERQYDSAVVPVSVLEDTGVNELWRVIRGWLGAGPFQSQEAPWARRY